MKGGNSSGLGHDGGLVMKGRLCHEDGPAL